ncbi:hypothetical protein V1502_09845 [Bacillus sp. SCS-153A]|uniref:hypothetical protein n=1 Tax=Rossellomorea sedimentorum TaxID=3115294 RepID=UPI0039063266
MGKILHSLKKFFDAAPNHCPELPRVSEASKCLMVKDRLAYSIQYDPHSKILFQYIKKNVTLKEAMETAGRLAPGWRIATPGEVLGVSGLFAHVTETSFNQCPLLVWCDCLETKKIAVINPKSDNLLTLWDAGSKCKAEVIYVFDRNRQ